MEADEVVEFEINEELTCVSANALSADIKPATACSTSGDIKVKLTRKRKSSFYTDRKFNCKYCPSILISLEDLINHEWACHKGECTFLNLFKNDI
jgi:hypothetical protein